MTESEQYKLELAIEQAHERLPATPSWFQAGTVTQTENVLRGLHPLGFSLLETPGHTCGSCAHARRKVLGKTYRKCALHHTGGPATDIRLKWAACEHYERRVAHGEG